MYLEMVLKETTVYNYVRYFADFNTFQGNRTVRALQRCMATK